jgi:hypothetical protein
MGDYDRQCTRLSSGSLGVHPLIMENFSKRTTAIIIVCFLLFALGWGFVWQKAGDNPVVHCDYHFPNMTCSTPEGGSGWGD